MGATDRANSPRPAQPRILGCNGVWRTTSTRTGPKPDPNSTQTRPELDPNRARTGPEPGDATRAKGCDHDGMSDSRRRPSAELKAASSASPQRSPLFRWLSENHDAIVGDGSPLRDWEPFRAYAAANGIVDGSGREPTKLVMKRVWHAVRTGRRKDLARLAQAAPLDPFAAAVGATTPDAPQAVERPPPPKPKPLAPRPATIAVQQAEPAPPDQQSQQTEGQARIDRVLAQLKARSDRRHGIF